MVEHWKKKTFTEKKELVLRILVLEMNLLIKLEKEIESWTEEELNSFLGGFQFGLEIIGKNFREGN